MGGKGVTVNAICPGYVATDLVWNGARNVAARTGKSFEEAVAAMARMNPGGRLIEPVRNRCAQETAAITRERGTRATLPTSAVPFTVLNA